MEEKKVLLDVKNLRTSFFTEAGEVKSVNDVSFHAVSYTHLDVYKRQVYLYPVLFAGDNDSRIIIKDPVHHIDNRTAVSYTQLDVYKRQGHIRAAMGTILNHSSTASGIIKG